MSFQKEFIDFQITVYVAYDIRHLGDDVTRSLPSADILTVLTALERKGWLCTRPADMSRVPRGTWRVTRLQVVTSLISAWTVAPSGTRLRAEISQKCRNGAETVGWVTVT